MSVRTDVEMMSAGQNRALHAALWSVHQARGADRFPVLSRLVGREVTTTKDLTYAEASRALNAMKPTFTEEDPF